MPLGEWWAYVPSDKEHYKSAGAVIRYLCRAVARNGNLLLDVGPDANGEIDPVATTRLKEVGAWLKLNGEAIYDTRPAKPYEQGDCVFTRKSDGTAYAIVLAKDDRGAMPERIVIPAELTAKASKIRLLGFAGELSAGETQNGQTTMVFPAAARANSPCAHAWTIKITR